MVYSRAKTWVILRDVVDKAQCAGVEDFDQETDTSLCDGCPIIEQCYRYAQADGSAVGLWGGRLWRLELKGEIDE